MKEIQRYRFLLSRQIRILGGFSGQRACDRRIAKLIKAGYIERRYIIYGIPQLYFITKKAVRLLNMKYYSNSVRIENIVHDIATVDVAIWLMKSENIDPSCITTERELRHEAGFRTNKHFPDIVFTKDNKNICVEVELSVKKLTTLEKNIKGNFKDFDEQIWFIPSDKPKIIKNVKAVGEKYGVKIVPLEKVVDYVGNL